jgi:hypothetical protein
MKSVSFGVSLLQTNTNTPIQTCPKRFFVHKSSRVVSYHLNTSKVQELGTLDVSVTELENTFPYTACWMRDLFENN